MLMGEGRKAGGFSSVVPLRSSACMHVLFVVREKESRYHLSTGVSDGVGFVACFLIVEEGVTHLDFGVDTYPRMGIALP